MIRARDAALQVLLRVETGQAFAAAALHSLLDKRWDSRDAALASELVFGVLRRRPWLDRLLESASAKGLKKIDPVTRQVLRIGAYQIAFLERIPAHAAVSEAVSQVKKRDLGGLAGLVNAVLRRLAEQPLSALDPSTVPNICSADDLACRLGLPAWLFERLCAAWGPERTAAIARAFNGPSRRTLRANRLRTSRDDLARELGDRATPGRLSPWALDVSCPAAANDLVEQGLAINQDEGSQLAVLALDPRPDQRILDMCAGRGGKCSTLAVAAGGRARIVAADKNANKLSRLELDLAGQGLTAETICADMIRSTGAIEPGFDRILLDAPCSGTGTLGRRPEIRWRLQERMVEDLVAVQSGLLDAAAKLLNPQGRLVYAVCSILPEEGAGHLDGFLDRHRDFHPEKEPVECWPEAVPWQNGAVFVDPSSTATDGYQLLVFHKGS